MSAPSRVGIAINQATNDIYLESSGALAVVNDALAVGQHVRQRLMTFEGEWFLDTTAGVPWLAQILGKGYDAALAEALVKNEIMDTDGVLEITSFSVKYNRSVRNLDISSVDVKTDYDEDAPV